VRGRFVIPDGVVYLDGNSLGALPQQTPGRVAAAVEQEWGQGLVRSWLDAHWMEAPARVGDKLARFVGAGEGEVVVAESTSVCLFKLLCAALTMQAGRSVVLTEEENFHTDLYVAAAAARISGATMKVVPRERLHDELLDPLVRRVFAIMSRNGQLPPAPPAVAQSGVQVEFTSMLASAQKAAATGAIERFWQFGAQIGAVKPEALDRLDPDGTMDAYADMTGVPASILVDLRKAEAARQQRAQAQAQQGQMANLMNVVKGAKTASEIDVGGGMNAVQAMLGR